MFSPLELEKIEFETKLGGYKKESVDHFMSVFCKDYETLYKENIAYKDKVGVLEELVSKYKSMEDSMHSALMLAQTTSEAALKNATEKADQMIAAAQNKIDIMNKEAEEKVREIAVKQDDMKRNTAAFVTKNIAVLKTQIDILNGMLEEVLSSHSNMQGSEGKD